MSTIRTIPPYYCKVNSIKTRIVAVLIEDNIFLDIDCKVNSIKTRIVADEARIAELAIDKLQS